MMFSVNLVTVLSIFIFSSENFVDLIFISRRFEKRIQSGFLRFHFAEGWHVCGALEIN